VAGQTYRDYEHIVVDDGSQDETVNRILELKDTYPDLYGNIVVLETNHRNRMVARNRGMEAASGSWFVWLDSDDALDSEYLHTFDFNIRGEPDAHLWVCGAVVHGMHKSDDGRHLCPKWTKLRKAYDPPMSKKDDEVHRHFPSGHVGTGMFVYSREAFDEIGTMPGWITPYDIADGVDEWLGYETGYSAAEQWVGNPYGDDWAYFRKLTQKFRVHTIGSNLYVQYVR
jgi:glycosyltransferase involved in cell wall biosynthesis